MREEQQQRHDVVQIGRCDPGGELLAARVDQIARLRVHHHELHHLAHGEGRLPPDVLGVQRHEVVRVHDCVDHAVQHDRQIHVAVVAHVQVQPVELGEEGREIVVSKRAQMNADSTTYQEDAGVMVNVEETKLLPSLLSDDEHRIQEIQNLRQVEHIQNEANWRIHMIKRIAWH